VKIPFSSIRSVVKANGILILPNTIKVVEAVVQTNGSVIEKEHDFTSFLWRDDCYALLTQLTNHSKKLT
jgi:hypothetical protein